jgi:hypothetical protein
MRVVSFESVHSTTSDHVFRAVMLSYTIFFEHDPEDRKYHTILTMIIEECSQMLDQYDPGEYPSRESSKFMQNCTSFGHV